MAPINVVLDIQNIYLPILTCEEDAGEVYPLPSFHRSITHYAHLRASICGSSNSLQQNELYNDITPSITMQIPAADDVCPPPSARFQEYSRAAGFRTFEAYFILRIPYNI
ncbi:hypothetical protein G7Y89_g670 [Cudoniella acicularis]|uniref:Uncharacterized protein n=1 Tax=Cudoniella acicularis TaxID=354080 RepID=A0A8H4RXQ8_9HELO|nr:hypothetical protein G7Y89_g670 [Cudoniella acicularis]